MTELDTYIFKARPSLRRAFFFAICYAALVCFGRFQTDLDPTFNPYWWGAFYTLIALLAVVFLKRATTLYAITDQDIRLTEGILARRMAIAPYHQITNVAARQGVLERLLGLVNLHIDTAGGDFSEVVFRRITKADAKAAGVIIRGIIASRSSPAKPAQAQNA